MAIESTLVPPPTQAVRAVADSDKRGSGGHAKRDSQSRQAHETPHPVCNDQGQVTGALIDVTA